MLSSILEAKTTEFSDLSRGLEYLRSKETRQVIVPSSSLEVTEDGFLVSRNGQEKVQGRMTDFSLNLLHGILRIPSSYAHRLDPKLHATNINDLLSKRLSPLVVISEGDAGQGAQEPHVTAILPSQPVVIPHDVILGHLVSREMPGRVFLGPGHMEAMVSGQESVEILPQDAFSIEGCVVNSQLGLRKWPFEVSAFLTRLICANGMVARRSIISGRLGMWSQSPGKLAEFLDRQLEAALNLISSGLKAAFERMSGTHVGEEEKATLVEEVRRVVGTKLIEKLFEKAATIYDCANEITALANGLVDRERKRRLWIVGGGIIERYLEN